MKIQLRGQLDLVTQGAEWILPELGFERGEGEMILDASVCAENALSVTRRGAHVSVSYGRPAYFFRALSLLKENLAQDSFEIREDAQFDTNGVMFDVCQGNAVINLPTVKEFLRRMAMMGLNMVMLYTEDSYDVPGEPYFGYMRGRYSAADLKEIDDYAYALGIEAIPCMQTLAHLMDVLKWAPYQAFIDDDDTLLVGDERTYAFVERMIAAVSAPFRSKRIHIGMDEAWKLGQGRYLLKNGYQPKHEIMREHLDRVLAIVKKYGKEPMIWSDMYLRSISENGDYYDTRTEVTEDLRASVPAGLSLVYWDYYKFTQEEYEYFLDKHQKLAGKPIFAGGIWTWQGYAATYDITNRTTNCALNACKKLGVREVFATIWGDSGTESNVYSTLLGMQLFAEHGFSASEPSVETVTRRFKTCTGGEYEDFYALTYFDRLDRVNEENVYHYGNPSKFFMWQDILAGIFDKNYENVDLDAHYARLAQEMRAASVRNGKWNDMFLFYALAAEVLTLKAGLGVHAYRAYKGGDRAFLARMRDEILPALHDKLDELRRFHMEVWMSMNHPLGWEVLDVRYGAVLARTKSIRVRLDDYLAGRVESLPELAEERLYFAGEPGDVTCIWYTKMPSSSRLSIQMGW